MGTDIHMRAEFRPGNGRPWEPVGAIFAYDYFDPISAFESGRDNPRPLTAEPYGGRNYTLFAVLANVRNGYGFAGVETHKPLVPISEPKGLPDDLAKHDVRLDAYDYFLDAEEESDANEDDIARSYLFGDHSFSWLSLRELLSYDWDQPLYDSGCVSAQEYLRLRIEGGQPESWCGSTSAETIEVDEAERRIAAATFPRKRDGKPNPLDFSAPYVRYNWVVPLRESIGGDWFRLLDRMRRWGRNWDT